MPRLSVLVAAVAVALTLIEGSATAAPGPCEQIEAACQGAGFVRGGAKAGTGIQVDCVDPLMRGRGQPRRASRPLPQIDPKVVAACRAQNPHFGQANAPGPAVASTAPPAPVPTPAAHARAVGRPNIVFILTDDLSTNLLPFMPHVLKMQKEGVTFANYFVTDSLCCPSRSSIFTGRYPHNTGVFRNVGADGGYSAFESHGNEGMTFAVALSTAGYRTAMLGKYLNGYLPERHPPAQGWTFWAVAGAAYKEFQYRLNEDRNVVSYGQTPADYLTDVVSGLSQSFIKRPDASPFILEVATFAPHAPYTPAPRDANAFPTLRAPRTRAYDAAPDAAAPAWLRKIPALSSGDMAAIDRDFRKRAQSVLAVDAMIGELQAAVAASGQAGNTYFVFSSDNGYHMGEYRLMPGKMTAFDTDIRVPLIVTGPGVPAGHVVEEIVENVDLYATFAELAGAPIPAEVDGRSLVPLMRGERPADWRSIALVEHRGPHKDPSDPDAPAARSGNPQSYEAIRARNWLYVEYDGGEAEYHDLASDPDELHNTFASLPAAERSSLHAIVAAVRSCRGATACSAAEHVASGNAAR
ncbi:MAG: sulfatase [Acidobacteriota bacterium]